MKNKKELTVKYISLSIGVLLIICAILYNVKSNFTVGTVFCYALGAMLASYGIFHRTLSKKLPRWLKYTALFGLAFIFVFASAIYICGNSDNVTYEEDVIIVLGAGIKGERIGVNLQNRLDTALSYHEKNPNALIVVSGGQGPYEDITEALAMERYLIGHGVPSEKIIREERSTSTEENFAFSKSVIDSRLGAGSYKCAFITNGYHIYRASLYAENAGFSEMTHLHAETPWYTAVPNGLREVIAVLKSWIVD